MLCVHLVYSIYYFREIFTFFVVLIVLTIKIYFENLILEYSIRSTDPQRYICFAEYPPYHSTIFTFSSCLPSHPTQDRHSPPYQTVKTIVAEPSCEDAPPRGPRRAQERTGWKARQGPWRGPRQARTQARTYYYATRGFSKKVHGAVSKYYLIYCLLHLD